MGEYMLVYKGDTEKRETLLNLIPMAEPKEDKLFSLLSFITSNSSDYFMIDHFNCIRISTSQIPFPNT